MWLAQLNREHDDCFPLSLIWVQAKFNVEPGNRICDLHKMCNDAGLDQSKRYFNAATVEVMVLESIFFDWKIDNSWNEVNAQFLWTAVQRLHIGPISVRYRNLNRPDIGYLYRSDIGCATRLQIGPISAADIGCILVYRSRADIDKTAFLGLYSFKSPCTPTLSDLWATSTGIRKNIASMANHRTV